MRDFVQNSETLMQAVDVLRQRCAVIKFFRFTEQIIRFRPAVNVVEGTVFQEGQALRT